MHPVDAEPQGFDLSTDEPNESKTKRKAKTFLLPHEELPEAWEKLCREVRPDLDPKRVFINFRFFFTEGRGAGIRRSERGWNQSWCNWIGREKEGHVKGGKNAAAPLPPHKDPGFHFGEDYYKKSLNPDGTPKWD